MLNRTPHFAKRLFALDDSPERIARAFALGVFLAFSPLIGLHAFLGLIIAFSFGLNRFALLLGVFINNPWTLIPIYAAGAYLGGMLMGFPPRYALPNFELKAIWSSDFWVQLAGQWHILKPMLLGSTVLSIIVSSFSYLAVLHLIKHRRIQREQH
jgi:uncharacterized protein